MFKHYKHIKFLDTKSFYDSSSKYGNSMAASLAEVEYENGEKVFAVGYIVSDTDGVLATFKEEQKESALNFFNALGKN
jgi:hypothetical protein